MPVGIIRERRSEPTRLVNFYIPDSLLEQFDEWSYRNRQSRTKALCNLIKTHLDSQGDSNEATA